MRARNIWPALSLFGVLTHFLNANRFPLHLKMLETHRVRSRPLAPSQATDASRAFLSALPEGLIAPDLFRLEVRAALIKLEARASCPQTMARQGSDSSKR